MTFVPAERLQVEEKFYEEFLFRPFARTNIPSMMLEPIVLLDTGR